MEFDLEFFRENNFVRKQCSVCSSYFWTLDDKRSTCGDPACNGYSFINKSPVYKKYNVDEMRDEFIKFFENDSLPHKFVEPYPVVPRWRDDVLLVNASIYDFQPQVTSGLAKPPGNPIVMSQPSIRMLDIDLVGKTGRHLTSFEMLCHDSFNYDDNYIYWKDETVRYSFRFLTERLRVDPLLITYKEKPWFGGGNAGNALEVFVMGLEVATLVFMDLKEDKNGDIELEGTRYSRMPLRVVDTGYGLERLVWLSTGTPTVYESIYKRSLDYIIKNSNAEYVSPEIMARISEIAAEIDPYSDELVLSRINKTGDKKFMEMLDNIRSAYGLVDHARTLLLMFSDYVIPSNVKVGYLARMLLRRSFRFMEKIKFNGSINDIFDAVYDEFNKIIKNYDKDFINNIIKIETEKYKEMLRSAPEIIRKHINKNTISNENIAKIYDTYGIPLEIISKVFKDLTNKELDIPENFQEYLVKLHENVKKPEKTVKDYPDINTRPLYYNDTGIMEFTGIVMYSNGNEIILNQTAFYPEGGGQPADHGYFLYNGKKIEVLDVQKYGNSIVHIINGSIPGHSRIKGFVDKERRTQLMIHHSATHLLLGICRAYFGEHVWQNSVKKDIDESRLDITHYKKITEDDIKNIENMCLDAIMASKNIHVKNIEWNRAISEYGFRLFEGGFPLSDTIRVVTIDDIDSEGCGGTHLKNTKDILMLKIVSTETVQEGIQRIVFTAGPAALRYSQKLYSIINDEQEYLKVPPEKIPEQSIKLVRENIENKKMINSLERELAEIYIKNALRIDDESFYIKSNEILSRVILKYTGARNGRFIINTGSRIYISSSYNDADVIASMLSNNYSGSKRVAICDCNANENLIKEILVKIKR
ncbi:alanine--tRNA ligase [Picrophilus oshimae]|uniref:Alanine--tRNA ligase n=1 Tax=Picrophilus torridus (strain ATCC 700027 / DSM 9790 / JCM 10055 / NBRC 100828 / KAW 2/3) TaxID=1122961 RepID=SYA_PICTO|nr:alanine--tRNA ligase [Picrophilus oshimae]Q6L1Z4.1 RecName: Full=Alanine--tRNA ligase; AltName: Full=Alanyl-tRNA synthetase; Short=AlaRS [Picrophilus oshimae DSM 9789]AAT43008.1 alanyl-tRNA synthetase [Picrophilus oshimae DSM 9789]